MASSRARKPGLKQALLRETYGLRVSTTADAMFAFLEQQLQGRIATLELPSCEIVVSREMRNSPEEAWRYPSHPGLLLISGLHGYIAASQDQKLAVNVIRDTNRADLMVIRDGIVVLDGDPELFPQTTRGGVPTSLAAFRRDTQLTGHWGQVTPTYGKINLYNEADNPAFFVGGSRIAAYHQ